MNPLEILAEYLDPVLGDGVQVYGYPPDSVTVPAVAMNPVTILPYTQGGPSVLAWGVDVKVVVSRSQPLYALRELYDLEAGVRAALNGAPQVTRFVETTDFTTNPVGEVDYLQATMSIIIIEELTP